MMCISIKILLKNFRFDLYYQIVKIRENITLELLMTTLESYKTTSISPPKTIQSRPNPENKPFEESYKLAYSHGLESIYAIETIDLKSVRRIETPSKIAPEKPKPQIRKNAPLQEEFDLGEEFRNWITPFIKREPIQVLNLSKHTEKCLIENGKKLLGDLIGFDLREFVSVRGMGQGHIEEIKQNLKAYINGYDLEKSDKVDFVSWIKCLVAAEDRKKAYVFLQAYELQDLISLTPGENVEVRKLTLEKKQECVEELLSHIVTTEYKKSVADDMLSIMNVFIKPWISRRGGFAAKEEIYERLNRISLDPTAATKVLNLLENVFFDKDLLPNFLIEADEGIYSSARYHSQAYELIVSNAHTYFYKPQVYYQFQELAALIERECAVNWIGFLDGYLEKVLRCSPQFHVIKGHSGKLEIYSQ
jgi:hypothetical protein